MATTFIKRIRTIITHFNQTVDFWIFRRYPQDHLNWNTLNLDIYQRNTISFDIKQIIDNGILWAVPKSRRTVEKRLKRKYGVPKYIEKILHPKTNIRTCNTCGDDHLTGVLCPTCYKRVIDETKVMQDAIQKELKLEPVENEVVVLYKDEKNGKLSEFYKGKRIVEMEKERPKWFSNNLLQKTTQQPATTKDIKPSDLS